MSSNDRQNRFNRQQPAPSEPIYEDDVVFEDEWDFEDDFEAPSPTQQPDRRGAGTTAPNRSSNAYRQSANEGTAAQIDRLQRNLGQPRQQQPSRAPVRQAPRTTPTQQTGRYSIPNEDVFVDDDYLDTPTPAQRGGRSGNAQAQRPTNNTRSYVRDTRSKPDLNADYDEYDWGDEYSQYDEYDDGFSEYDEPRRPARGARQTPQMPQIRMPAISRPTMPKVISSADLVNDAPALGIIGVSLASLAAMAILVANRADSLAPQFATHVSASGILENFKGESALWNIPLMAAMLTAMNIAIAWFISPLDRFASRFVLAGALVVQFLAWVALIRIL